MGEEMSSSLCLMYVKMDFESEDMMKCGQISPKKSDADLDTNFACTTIRILKPHRVLVLYRFYEGMSKDGCAYFCKKLQYGLKRTLQHGWFVSYCVRGYCGYCPHG